MIRKQSIPKLNLGRRYFAIGKARVSLSDAQREARNAVRKLMEDGTYEFESVPCLCGVSAKNDLLLATVDRYGLEHRTVICQACGLVRADPRLNQVSYNHFYENWYRQLHSGWAHVDEAGFKKQFEHFSLKGQRIIELLQGNGNDLAGSTVLDIGCGGGWTLPPFARCGAKTIGFDYGKYMEFGRRLYGLDLRYGGTKEAIDQGVEADLIILSHVLEHFADPMNELKELRRLLKPGGIVYIETPGILGPDIRKVDYDLMRLIVLAHTYLFSKYLLGHFVRKCGYHVQYSDECIYMLCRLPTTELDDAGTAGQHAQVVIQYLRDCERKRIPRYLWKRCRSFVSQTLRILGVYPLARRLYHKISGISGKRLT